MEKVDEAAEDLATENPGQSKKKKKTEPVDVDETVVEACPVQLDHDVPKKKKKKKKSRAEQKENPVDDSSDEEEDVGVPKKKRAKKAIIDSSDEDSNDASVEGIDKDALGHDAGEDVKDKIATPSRIKRCLESSDDEGESTPKLDRIKKLKIMSNNLQKKKLKPLELFEDEADEVNSDTDEDNLPMFDHEDAPPDSDQDIPEPAEESEDDDRDFLDDADEEEEEEEEEEDGDEEEESGEDSEAESSDGGGYNNPYLDNNSLT